MWRILGIGAAATFLLGGCMTGSIDPPDGYLQIESGPQYDKRYLSVDGNVIAVRTVANPKGGTLDYWTEAIRREMVDSAGYTPKDRQAVKAGSVPGTLFEFTVPVGGVGHTYLVGVFVQGSRIIVVEAGGASDKVAADRERLVKAIRSVR